MNQTTWMKWEQVPWLARSELTSSLLRLCDRLLELALAADNSPLFLRDELPDIANEFSVQWAGIMKRTPDWKVVAEFGRRSIPELPYQFLSESLDRDAVGLQVMETVGSTLMSIPLPKSGTPGQALVLVGPALAPEYAPEYATDARSRLYDPAYTHLFRRGEGKA